MNTRDLLQSRFGHALRTQAKAEHTQAFAFPCPYGGHRGRIFKNIDQLFDHVKDEHQAEIAGLSRQARALVKEAAIKLRRSDISSEATAGNQSAPDLASLSLDPRRETRQSSPPSGEERRVDDDFHGRRIVYEIPGHLSKAGLGAVETYVQGLGDTAAKYCFMKEDFAVQQGLDVDRSDTRRVKLMKNHETTTTGTVHVGFRFDGEIDVYRLKFHLLPTCIHDVILGKSFLKLTKTFSDLKNFTRRVKQRLLEGLSHFHLLYLGDSAPKFTGLLNGRPREALADWGANGLIMDEDFARKQGLPILDGPEHHNTVYLADNTKTRTSGMVHGIRWEFGLSGSGQEHSLDFHILKNAPADIILSDDFLSQTSAFIEYDCYLIDEDDEDDEAEAYFFGIKIDVRNNMPVSVSEQMSEDARRDAEDDRIDNLPRLEQHEARQRENHRRDAWDAQHRASTGSDGASTSGISSGTPSVVARTSTSNESTGTPPSVTVSSRMPPSGTSAQAVAVPPPGEAPSSTKPKRSRWRFKLKANKSVRV